MSSSSEPNSRGVGKFSGWAAIAGLEAAIRLFLQVVTTVVLARLLTPDDFGTTALVLTVVTIFSVFAALSFEEPLSQRKRLRGLHVHTALAASWAMGLFCLILSIPLGAALGWFYDAPLFVWLLPVASLLLFPNGVMVIATALARRRKKFNAMAIGSLAGNLAGSVAAIALAVLGAGLWALIAFRVVTLFVQAAVLVCLLKFSLRPRWSTRHYRDLSRFFWFIMWDRLTDNMTYLLFNFMVASMFGLNVLGHFNMALRVIEPVRGSVITISHNLAFSLLMPAAHGAGNLREMVRVLCGRATLLTAPAFLGIAAVAPVLIPVLAGPGWEDSVLIAQILGVGGALVTATQLVITGLSALGSPQYSLWRGLTRLVVIVVALVGIGSFGAIAVGLSRLAGDITDMLGALWLSCRKLGMAPFELAGELFRPMLAAALMAVAVAWVVAALQGTMHNVLTLILSVLAGSLLYPVFVLIIDRKAMRWFLSAVLHR